MSEAEKDTQRALAAAEGIYATGSSGFPSAYSLSCLGCRHIWRPRQATVDKVLKAHLEQ
ncbi:hypothetical protein [Pseudovibrio axinellae]|uniref:hypothetical protein n=1 Tax=Pseudovibrio axinellae TaxID=989403 RepID=UPI000A558FE7|nr:hypothetical protein [Pseudovibrio axinellae]